MREYIVRFARSARKELESLDSLLVARIGEYRIVYEILDDAGLIDVVAVRHRKDAYQ